MSDIIQLHDWEDALNMGLENHQCLCNQIDCEGDCNDEMGDLIAEAHADESKIERGEVE